MTGCNPPHCIGCCNSELIDFNTGKPASEYMNRIRKYIEDYDNLIHNIFLLGGSFNHQSDEDLQWFFEELVLVTLKQNGKFDKKIWLFTREDIEDVKPIFTKYCDYIKTGSYIEELATDNHIQYDIKLASSNQNIWKKHYD